MPLVYAMTLGELARMFAAENKMGLDLHVIAMKNWRRSQTFDQTGLKWIPPSPNLRTLNEAFLYPGIEILQPAGISVGRGTDAPFEQLGAPWVRSDALLNSLTPRQIPGVSFAAASFTPTDGLYKGEACAGVKLTITDREAFDSIRTGLEISDALHRLYPERFQVTKLMDLLASQTTVDALIQYQAPANIIASWASDLAQFRALRAICSTIDRRKNAARRAAATRARVRYYNSMRIVSLLPSATEILYALGVGEQVVGITHECDFPPEAAGKPALIKPRVDPTAAPAEIDRQVSELVARGESIYAVDADLLASLAPDLIVTQDLCHVCAASPDDLAAALSRFSRPPRVLTLTPHSLDGVWQDVIRAGEATNTSPRAEALAARLKQKCKPSRPPPRKPPANPPSARA